LFEAFIDGKKKVSSNKRGAKGEEEFLAVESVRECVNARSRQNRIKDNAVAALEQKINKYDLLQNKILFIRLEDEDDFPAVLNGLIAMELSQKFKRPTIVARLNKDGEIKGSARGLNDSELRDFKQFLTDSGYFDYTAGHPNAFGIGVKDEKLRSFHDYANHQLDEFDFNEDIYDVQFVRKANDRDIRDMVEDLEQYRNVWGQSCSEPLIYVSDINLTKDNIQVIGERKDTVKFEKNGVTYIQFFAKELIEELKRFEVIKIQIIGRCNLNEWMGRKTPQIIIENYEVENGILSF
jgi:single-stranded-DNA-specific exonuclease